MKKLGLLPLYSLAVACVLSAGCGRNEVPPTTDQAAATDSVDAADTGTGQAAEPPSEASTQPPPGDSAEAEPNRVAESTAQPSPPMLPPVAAADAANDSAGEDSKGEDSANAKDAAATETEPSTVKETTADASDPAAESDDRSVWRREGPTGEEIARAAFLPPPASKSLSEHGRLWIDAKRKRVYLDGYVTLKRGPLEMFACPVGTKEHESIVAALARSREVHAALLAVGADSGTPVRFQPEYLPPTGQIIRVFVCWYDAQGDFHAADARQWILDLQTEKTMQAEWVFAGSGFWQDPEDKREYYLADSGDMICVSNFSSAMLDVAIPSSADTGSLRFVPMEDRIPDLDTPVRLVLVPVPNPGDDADPQQAEALLELPEPSVVPRKPASADAAAK
jgi:hypothetical protein